MLKLIRNPNLSSQYNHLPNNVLNNLNSPMGTIGQLRSYVNPCTDEFTNSQEQMKEYMYLFILHKQVIEFFSDDTRDLVSTSNQHISITLVSLSDYIENSLL